MGSATLVSSPKISSSLTKVVTAGLYQNEPSTKQNREIKIEMMMMVEMEPVRTGRFHLVPGWFSLVTQDPVEPARFTLPKT